MQACHLTEKHKYCNCTVYETEIETVSQVLGVFSDTDRQENLQIMELSLVKFLKDWLMLCKN